MIEKAKARLQRDGVIDSLRHISLRDVGRQLLVENLTRDCIRQCAFQSVANFEARNALFEKQKEDRSVVASLPADLPGLGRADREAFDVVGGSFREDHDRDLIRRFFFEACQGRVDARGVGGQHHASEIVDVAGQALQRSHVSAF